MHHPRETEGTRGGTQEQFGYGAGGVWRGQEIMTTKTQHGAPGLNQLLPAIECATPEGPVVKHETSNISILQNPTNVKRTFKGTPRSCCRVGQTLLCARANTPLRRILIAPRILCAGTGGYVKHLHTNLRGRLATVMPPDGLCDLSQQRDPFHRLPRLADVNLPNTAPAQPAPTAAGKKQTTLLLLPTCRISVVDYSFYLYI